MSQTRPPHLGQRRSLARLSALVLSLVPTPLLVFISSSSALYLKNKNLFLNQPAVLLPFLKLFSITLLVGTLLAGLARRKPFRSALWAYYLAGPLFLVFASSRLHREEFPFLSGLHDSAGGLAVWPVALAVASIVLGRRLSTGALVKPFAVFGGLLLVAEISVFALEARSLGPASIGSVPSPVSDEPATPLPNIYHVVLDEFQTDYFDVAATPDTKRALGGFVYFPNNTSVYSYTPWSMASLFKGKAYAYDRTRGQFVSEAYNSRDSLLYWLKKNGYTTAAFIHGENSDVGPAFSANHLRRYSLFDRLVSLRHRAPPELARLNTDTLWTVWVYGNVPEPIREALGRAGWLSSLDDETLQLLEDRRMLTRSDPVVSYLGFRSFLEEEGGLPESNRYTLVHLMLPHTPYELGADCSLQPLKTPSDPIDQTKCTLKLMQDFMTRLRRLSRFEESLILIHGDHGGGFRMKDGTLTRQARSKSLRALLLIKPFGASREDGFAVSETPTTLLDIAPFIMRSVTRARAARSDRLEIKPDWAVSTRIVPFIEGESLWSVRRILKRRGLALGKVTRVPSERFPPDTVIAQSPGAYEEVGGVAEVAVLVSGRPGSTKSASAAGQR